MTMTNNYDLPSPGHALLQLAQDEPNAHAAIFVDRAGNESSVSRSEVLAQARAVANYLVELGVQENDLIVVSLPKSLEHMYAMLGVWWVGACPLPINPSAPAPEIERIMAVANPVVTMASSTGVAELLNGEDLELPPRHPQNSGAFLSGGSTGMPKVIHVNSPWGRGARKLLNACGVRTGQTQLVSGPWYHNGPIAWAHFGLAMGHRLVVMERFEANQSVELIEKHHVQSLLLVPTMMNRIAAIKDIGRENFNSVESVVHTSAACPSWLKYKWIDLVGPQKIFEAYGSTEGIGHAVIRGDEWQRHEGSVGKPLAKVEVLDPKTKKSAPSGEVGELWWQLPDSGLPFEYLGAKPQVNGGLASVGDLGWLDENGYLFIADKSTDLIISGGSNVFPAEVEGVVGEHPSVVDVVVTGLPDDDWGSIVHAIVVTAPGVTLELDEIRAWCKERMAPYKAPRGLEHVTEIPRNDAGKVRRQALRDERVESNSKGSGLSTGVDP